MGEQSKIQWTDDTHNFWQGCTKVSGGCKNCYAEARDKRFTGGKLWGVGAPRQRSASFNKPVSWNRQPWICDACGQPHQINSQICSKPGCDCETKHRRRVFSLSLGDIGDPEVSFQWFNDAMAIVDKCQGLDFLLLTKRPEYFLERWNKVCEHWMRGSNALPDNVWMGTSVENQKSADSRIPDLIRIPARVRFLSCEPLLESVAFTTECHIPATEDHPGMVGYMVGQDDGKSILAVTRAEALSKSGIHWVIVGGESGHGARLCNIEWIRSVVRQCKAAQVPVFVKQLGAEPRCERAEMSKKEFRSGYWDADPFLKPILSNKKGGDIEEWPDDLKVREFPI